jgi:hypothetical protein
VPLSPLLLVSDGLFYGVVRGERFLHRCGLNFRIAGHGNFDIVHDFETQVDIDGKWPHCELLLDRDGALHGTTTRGGSGGGAGARRCSASRRMAKSSAQQTAPAA